MKSFLELNRTKIAFAFKATSLILTLFFVLIFIITWIATGLLPELQLLSMIVLATSIVLPLLLLGMAYVVWLINRMIRNKSFNKKPFNQLDQIGFTISYINDNTKWHFTEETKEAKLNGYIIQFDTNASGDWQKTFEFKAFIKKIVIEEERYKTLEKKFKQDNIYFGIGGLIKKYYLKGIDNLSIDQLKIELINFVESLRAEGLEPSESRIGWA
jgi:uncharacterized membrane protein (DUF485 family)